MQEYLDSGSVLIWFLVLVYIVEILTCAQHLIFGMGTIKAELGLVPSSKNVIVYDFPGKIENLRSIFHPRIVFANGGNAFLGAYYHFPLGWDWRSRQEFESPYDVFRWLREQRLSPNESRSGLFYMNRWSFASINKLYFCSYFRVPINGVDVGYP